MISQDLDRDRVIINEVLPLGQTLRLVRHEDDMLTIERDGAVLPGCIWRGFDEGKAILEFGLIRRQMGLAS